MPKGTTCEAEFACSTTSCIGYLTLLLVPVLEPTTVHLLPTDLP